MVLDEKYRLVNGIEIPKIGLGTWQIPNDVVVSAVSSAIQLGYRHIDTAQVYDNEEGVGQGIKDSNISRESLFITTKVAAEIKNYEEAVRSIALSLEKLDVEYIDLLLIHCPQPWSEYGSDKRYFEENVAVWKALEEAYEAGKVKAIGVSNFQIVDLENLFKNAKIKPMVNQVLAHAGNTPLELIEFAKANDILIEAYSPLAHGALLHNEAAGEIAAEYGVSIPRLCVRYALQLGLLPLPKTVTPANMKDNASVDFVISDEDMIKLQNIEVKR